MLAFFFISFIPLPVDYFVGNGGEMLFAPVAPVLLLIASGLVIVSWWALIILMWPLGKVRMLFFKRSVIFSAFVQFFLKA